MSKGGLVTATAEVWKQEEHQLGADDNIALNIDVLYRLKHSFCVSICTFVPATPSVFALLYQKARKARNVRTWSTEAWWWRGAEEEGVAWSESCRHDEALKLLVYEALSY